MADDDDKKFDAMGCEIEIGGLYGYANNQNGINNVWIGHAKKITKNGVTLDVIQHKTGAYGGLKIEEDTKWKKVPKTVNVKSIMIFPLPLIYENFIERQNKDA